MSGPKHGLIGVHIKVISATRTWMKDLDVGDKLIIQSINAIDEFDKIANLLATRLREWYGLYFPEIVLL